ncbi:MAG: sugar-binding protein, partial [Pseudomonadota bacterium]
MRRLALCCLLPLALNQPVAADNGAIAHAVRAGTITIDGRLGDWPAAARFQPIQRLQNGQLHPGDTGLDARWRAAWTAEAVYIAVEISDDAHRVAEDPEFSWNQQDGVIVYLDRNHSTRGSGAALYWVGGQNRRMLSDSGHWDPDVVAAGVDDFEVAVVHDDGRTIYEWKLLAAAPLRAGRTLGVDLLVSDADAEAMDAGGRLLVWGPGYGKSQGGGRIGDLLLLDDTATLGTVAGSVALAMDADD